MNRIVLYYEKGDDKKPSKLTIHNDLKGYTFEQIGQEYIGRHADIMFKLLSNVDYSKLEDCMCYGMNVNGKDIR